MSYDFAQINFDKITGTFTSSYDVPLTLAAWVKKTAAQWADASDNHIVMLSETTASNNSIKIRASLAADNVVATQTSTTDGSAQEAFADTTYDDVWVLVVGVFTADNDRDVYIETSANVGSSTADKPLTATLNTIAIGGGTHSDFAGFEGNIAEVCIWNMALGTADVDALQTAAQTGPAPNTIQSANVIGYWPLDADNATQLNEGSDAGGDLTVQSAAPYDADHPTITVAGGSSIPVLHHARQLHRMI